MLTSAIGHPRPPISLIEKKTRTKIPSGAGCQNAIEIIWLQKIIIEIIWLQKIIIKILTANENTETLFIE